MAAHPLPQQVALVLLGACGAGLGKPVLHVGTLGQGGVRLAVLLLLQRSLGATDTGVSRTVPIKSTLVWILDCFTFGFEFEKNAK